MSVLDSDLHIYTTWVV